MNKRLLSWIANADHQLSLAIDALTDVRDDLQSQIDEAEADTDLSATEDELSDIETAIDLLEQARGVLPSTVED